MSTQRRELYTSSNGDSWYLCRDRAGRIVVSHEPNVSSGGKPSHVEIVAYLATGKQGPAPFVIQPFTFRAYCRPSWAAAQYIIHFALLIPQACLRLLVVLRSAKSAYNQHCNPDKAVRASPAGVRNRPVGCLVVRSPPIGCGGKLLCLRCVIFAGPQRPTSKSANGILGKCRERTFRWRVRHTASAARFDGA